MNVVDNLDARRADLKGLVQALGQEPFFTAFVTAFQRDTGFLLHHIQEREIHGPAFILNLLAERGAAFQEPGFSMATRAPLGQVAVLLPKNTLGIPMSKALGSAYLLGNTLRVRIPPYFSACFDSYRSLLQTHLHGIEFAPQAMGAREFLRHCFADPEVDAVVIYGDDAWLDSYWEPAERSGTKVIFEGPGNDPLVVLPDADIAQAVAGAVRCGLNNGGQSCSALERFFVHRTRLDPLVTQLTEALAALPMGSAQDPSTAVGPIRSQRVVDRILRQIDAALTRGAERVWGGRVHDLGGEGWLVEPAVLGGCRWDDAVVQEENFGPLFPIVPFDDEDQLLHDLDQVRYGLNASVYGRPSQRLQEYIESNHRNYFYASTYVDQENRTARLLDGGYKRSGIVWQQTDGGYQVSHGRRFLTHLLSQEVSRT